MNWIKARASVVAGLVVIVVVGVVSPALGGPSLKKLVKREVSKQISKATGPAGAAGPDGAAGTARAYGRVDPFGCSPDCVVSRSKGISSVTRSTTGFYCVHAPGVDSGQVSAAVTVDSEESNSPAGAASAMASGSCDGTGFGVSTERQLTTLVCANDDCSSQAGVAGISTTAPNNVGFTIVIP
jgi:hypothetical protein